MISKSTELFADSLALTKSESCAFGIYKDYFVTVSEKKHNTVVDISCYFGDIEENSIEILTLSDAIKANIELYNIEDYELKYDSVSLVSSSDTELLVKMVDSVISILSENNIKGAQICPHCGKKFPKAEKKRIVTIGDEKHLACESCALEILEYSKEAPAVCQDEVKPSKSKIIIGALVGSLLGMLIYSALFFLISTKENTILKYFVCLAGLAVATLAIVFARLISKSNYSKAFVWCSTVCSLLFIFIGQYIGSVIYAVRCYGSFDMFKFNPSPFLGVVFTYNELLKFFLFGSLIGFCSAGVALIFGVSALTKDMSKQKKIDVSISTLK